MQRAVEGHLANSSRRTYARGHCLFSAFRITNDVPDNFFTELPTSYVHTLAECFACWLRYDKILKSTTIDQYFTHVCNFYKEQNAILNSGALRSPRLCMMLTAFASEDTIGRPVRLTEKIPLTAALMVLSYSLLIELYGSASAPLALGLAGALSIGYGLSLRPDEYLRNTPTPRSHTHTARGFKSFFQWSNDPSFYPVTRPDKYPKRPDPPVTFLTLLDSSKNDPRGHGAPRAVSAAPAGSSFCLVYRIFVCLRQYPPQGTGTLLSGLPSAFTNASVNQFLKQVATRAGLDPSRLVPHSARVGAIIQLARHSEATQCRQGNWSTIQGMLAYARGPLDHAAFVTADMHDVTLCTIDYLRLMCMTPTAIDATPMGPR